MDSRDGSQRYVAELLCGLHELLAQPGQSWEIDVHLGGREIAGLQHVVGTVLQRAEPTTAHTESSTGITARAGPGPATRLFTTLQRVLPGGIMAALQQWHRSLQSFIWARCKKIDYSRYDLVHLTLPQFYHTLADCPTALLTTVFDFSHVHYPQFHLRNNIVCTEKGLRFALDRRAQFIAISEATRRDFLLRYPRVEGAGIQTIHCGRDADTFAPVTDPQALRSVKQKYGLPDGPFLLSLSTLEPRKNLINSIRAFLHLLDTAPELDVSFVVAGKAGWQFEDIFDAAQMHRDRIVFTGFIADDDLPAIYSSALALSYVSYYEGFGLPPLEAMSCGTPVIYGDNSSMPEVIDGAGLAADPDDIPGIARQFHAVVADPALRKKLADNALSRAGLFSWRAMANETLALYGRVAAQAAARRTG